MNYKHIKNEKSGLREEKEEQGLSFIGFDLVINALLCSHGNRCCSAISVTWPPQPPFYIFMQKISSTGHPIFSLYITEIALDVMGTLATHPKDHQQMRRHEILSNIKLVIYKSQLQVIVSLLNEVIHGHFLLL